MRFHALSVATCALTSQRDEGDEEGTVRTFSPPPPEIMTFWYRSYSDTSRLSTQNS